MLKFKIVVNLPYFCNTWIKIATKITLNFLIDIAQVDIFIIYNKLLLYLKFNLLLIEYLKMIFYLINYYTIFSILFEGI